MRTTFALLLFIASVASAQYFEGYQQVPTDTTRKPTATEQQQPFYFQGTKIITGQDTVIADTTDDFIMDTMMTDTMQPAPTLGGVRQTPEEMIAATAKVWVRRMIFRGWLDDNVTGTWAEYQLTDWRPGGGSYGPVRARLTLYYLGATNWMGKPAARLQAAYRAMDDGSTIVEFDLLVSSSEKIGEVYRALYRINRGQLSPTNFRVPEDQVDYDKVDRPLNIGKEELRMYAGTYNAEVYQGSGTDGAIVYAYRSQTIPPFGLVVLGYGEEAMTITSYGSGAEPRFEAPSPAVR